MNNERGSLWNRWDLHLHTASSYDYEYKGSDADQILCKALTQNDIKAVAITDHFIIDKNRIMNLRSLAPEIVFFPGVELRTDKGSNNLHVILIFDENSNLDELSADFNAIMLRQKAKSKDSNESIYWNFEDIVEFAEEHNGLISIHAGRKTNGIDKEITNGIPVKEAIKSDIATAVHFFEIGQKRDIEDYEKYVFKEINRKPLIICSDNHHPKAYKTKENLWIKADLTFEGLKQCIYQPQERVYIGTIPQIVDRLTKNGQNNIKSISVHRVEKPRNNKVTWFDFDIPLNAGMVAVIGNKGSGKSAIADIIGHLCSCHTMEHASFLNPNRFRKLPKRFADDYEARLIWADGKEQSASLAYSEYKTSIEDAQYLPQQYIEEVCNDFEDVFQKEINKVIFSYVDKTERGEAQNLEELVEAKSRPLNLEISEYVTKLHDINSQIIKLEDKSTKEFKKGVKDSLQKAKDTLERHEKSKPVEVKKPEEKNDNSDYQDKLNEVNSKLETIQKSIDEVSTQLTDINSLIDDLNDALAQLTALEAQFIDTKTSVIELLNRHDVTLTSDVFSLRTPKADIKTLLRKAQEDKKQKQITLSDPEKGLYRQQKIAEDEKNAIISTADSEEKKYQKYLSDLEEWTTKKKTLIGDANTEDSVVFYQHELTYIENQLNDDYKIKIAERISIAEKLFETKKKFVEIYEEIYDPVQGEIIQLLGDLDDGIQFQAQIYMSMSNLPDRVISHINQRYSGKYGRGHNSNQEIEELIHSTDFADKDSILKFIAELSDAVTYDLENASIRISDRQGYYDFIFGMEYIKINFKLKMGTRDLKELSPGERGIVLLVFYLALSKESKPIIIDQPEDNLDNQSVYSKLVPCICKAKQRRQVIIVTHNPNIAVACDAEQIVYCEMNKRSDSIKYEAGSIENSKICQHVVDVLEGTMPAFDLRRRKYHEGTLISKSKKK